MSEVTLKALEQLLDNKLKAAVAPLATKQDVSNAVEDLARIIADTVAAPFTERFNSLEEAMKVKDDVQTLKRQMAEIRAALHLSA
jgi:hypothetical protein